MSADKREATVMKNFILTDRMHRRLFENRTAVMGVHRSQHRILMYLAKRNEAPAQKEIAEQFDVSPAAVAVTLKKLEDAGYGLTGGVYKARERIHRAVADARLLANP